MRSIRRLLAATTIAGTLAAALAIPASAMAPEVITGTADVDVAYFDCGTFEAHGVWTINRRVTVFHDASGTAVRDHEIVDFKGAFVNPETGASIPDSGRIVFFDTLAPDGSYLTTIQNTVRRNRYLHESFRYDFQADAFHGMSRFDAGIEAACKALGA